MPGETGVALARDQVVELMPMLRRGVTLDAAALVRFRVQSGVTAGFLRLPFGVLAGRAVRTDGTADDGSVLDITHRAQDVLDWSESGPVPARADADWRGGLPPVSGWQRLDEVPDDVIRPLVRAGATTLKQAAVREGVPDAQPRAEVSEALLDSIVLTVSGGSTNAELSLRMVSALTRMGFLPRDSSAGVDVAGRWVRISGRYGSVYAERPGAGLMVV
jgi:hypothetical protein